MLRSSCGEGSSSTAGRWGLAELSTIGGIMTLLSRGYLVSFGGEDGNVTLFSIWCSDATSPSRQPLAVSSLSDKDK
jgi:hypothetical protein